MRHNHKNSLSPSDGFELTFGRTKHNQYDTNFVDSMKAYTDRGFVWD